MTDVERLLQEYNRLRADKRHLTAEKQCLVERLNADIDRLNKEKQELLEKNREKQAYIDVILNSRSWKILSRLSKIKNITQPEPTIQDTIKIKEEKQKKEPEKKRGAYKLDTYKSYYEDNQDFSKYKTDIKTLAFYLPQFHRFKENDEWWGEGFTEWSNTKVAKPRFSGHYQPREPHDDFGYYSLDHKETFKKQVTLAKQHGIYGFAFYYYWFSGKQLMAKSMQVWLDNQKELDLPFCLCWANENWTRTWDGKEKDILIKQEYTENDPVNFIKDIKKYLLDKRYIKVDGKPLIMIYNPKEVPNFKKTVEAWRKTAKAEGIGEIEIWSKNSIFSDSILSNSGFVDGEFDFAPNTFNLPSCAINDNSQGLLYDYRKLVEQLDQEYFYTDHFSFTPFYYSCTTGWDNSSRRKDDGFTVFANYSPKSFYKWLRMIIEKTRLAHPEDKRFILIDAWNEWAEGTYLEPDKKYGYVNINTLSKAIFDLPYRKSND